MSNLRQRRIRLEWKIPSPNDKVFEIWILILGFTNFMFQWFQKLTKQKNILIIFTISVLLAGIFTVAQPATAALLDPLVPACRAEKGGCNVCDAIGVGINITKIMLGTLGSAALLMFVYGGVLMAISRGHSDQVQKGKDALTNAVKGVIIVLASWVVINYGLAIMLGSEDVSRPTTILGQNWATVACGSDKASSNSVCVYNGQTVSDGYSCGTNMAVMCNNQGQGECVTKCKREKGNLLYECLPLASCRDYNAGETWNDCDTQNMPNCSKNLCPQNNEVCCLP